MSADTRTPSVPKTVTGEPADWSESALLAYVPTRLQDGLRRYVCEGIAPGSFLQAIFRGDLFDAVGRADPDMLIWLPNICTFIFNYCPAPCWGSKQKVNAWVVKHAHERAIEPAEGG